MPSLEYYQLAEAFFKFEKVAKKYHFYEDEINRMERSLYEMNVAPEYDPKDIIDNLGSGKDESI